MSRFSEFRSGVRNVTGRATVEAELDEELHAYLEMLIAENIKAGATPEEARRAALMKIGSIERVKEEVRDVRLMFLTSTFPGLGFDKFWVSPPEYLELRERAKSYSDIAAYLTTAVNIADGTRPQRVPAIAMTASMFRALGVQPRLGRAFTAEEDMPNQNPVAVISDNLWRSTYGSDASIVGRQVEISGTQRTIIGVAPAGFDLHDTHADVFLPLGLDPANRMNRGSHFLYLITRLKPAVSPEQAAAELKTLVHQWRSMSGNITTHVPNDSAPTMHNLQFVPLRDE
ncbi:MAG: ABC transporter permease, partial [Gemmatimonadaceae bacterium]